MRPMPSRSSVSNKSRPSSRLRRVCASTFSHTGSSRESVTCTRVTSLPDSSGATKRASRFHVPSNLALHGARVEAAHVVVYEERIVNGDGDVAGVSRGHELAPVELVTPA